MTKPSPVTVTIDGVSYPVTFKGMFNRTERVGNAPSIRQQETDPTIHEDKATGQKLQFKNGPEQAATFNALGQELADVVSELHAQHNGAVLETLAQASRKIVTFGASNPAPQEFRDDMAAIDPRLGDLVDRYSAEWKKAADMGSPKLFQEDLADIVRTIRERSMGTISAAAGQPKEF